MPKSFVFQSGSIVNDFINYIKQSKTFSSLVLDSNSVRIYRLKYKGMVIHIPKDVQHLTLKALLSEIKNYEVFETDIPSDYRLRKITTATADDFDV